MCTHGEGKKLVRKRIYREDETRRRRAEFEYEYDFLGTMKHGVMHSQALSGNMN